VTTYDTLRADVFGAAPGEEPCLPPEQRAAFDLLLLDEAQCVKNRDSGRTRAVLAFAPGWRWALSGTPVENGLSDLATLFSFIAPRLLPETDLTPADAARLIAPYVKRRTKAEVMRELPPKIRQEVWLPLDAEQQRAYEATEAQGCRELEALGDRLSRVHVFSLLTRLKMICNFAPGRDDSPKLQALLDLVEQIAASGQKALVFTQWLEEGVDKLARALAPFGAVRFDARLSRAQRDAAVATFQERADRRVFLATVKSAGVGLTLTAASYVIHFDHWWNPAWMWQAEDRAHRRGQTQPVNVYSFWMADTIEARVHEILTKKGDLYAEVVGGLSEGAIDGLISMDDWLSLLRVGRRRSTGSPRPGRG
jgi:SNF2 family DNA or RNA helicase